MRFEWDTAKNRLNIRKHGFDFGDAEEMFREGGGCSLPDTIRLGMRRKNTRRRSGTDWKRIDTMTDREIDLSEVPELSSDFFAEAIHWPGKKQQITLRLDPDVLDFFRKHGKGYQTTINAVLRKYVESRRQRAG